jgi:hypothetical protein
MRSLIAGSLILIGLGSVAQAEVLASAGAYAGPTGVTALCYFTNTGGSWIYPTSVTIYREPNVVVPQLTSNCGTLPPNSTCRAYSSITVIANHWCKMVVPSKAALRGRMEIRNSSGVVLSSETMR